MIGDTLNFAEYAGNASTSTPYVIPFRYDAAGWVKVTVTNALGVITLLEQVTNYTLGGTGSTANGNFRTVVAVPSTSTIKVYREAPGVQSLDLSTNTPLPAISLEAQLDRLAMAAEDSVTARVMEARLAAIPVGPTGPVGPPSQPQRIITVTSNYTLNELTDHNAGILQTGGVITLPATPSLALQCFVKGAVVQLTCEAAFRHVAAGGLQTVTPAAGTLVLAPISPARAVCHCFYIGNEWFIFEF